MCAEKSSADAAYVDNFARWLHPNDSEWRLLAMLEAYFDESGSHEGSLVLAIGGLVARAEQWQVFASDWRRILEEAGVEEFHASDLENLQGVYKGWTNERKESLFQSASRVIGSYARQAIAGLVVVDEYEAVVPKWAKDTVAFGDKYNFCFQMCVGQTLGWIDGLKIPMPKGNTVSFAFDQREKGEQITRNSYTQIKKFRDPDDRMGALAFDSRKRLLPLQAADFIAYETYKHLDNLVKQSQRPQRASFEHLINSGCQLRGYYFGRERLLELVKYYEKTRNQNGQEPWWPLLRPDF